MRSSSQKLTICDYVPSEFFEVTNLAFINLETLKIFNRLTEVHIFDIEIPRFRITRSDDSRKFYAYYVKVFPAIVTLISCKATENGRTISITGESLHL